MDLLKPAKSVLGRKYHYRPPKVLHPYRLGSPAMRATGTPADAVDLRPLCTSVRDQGQEGACSGFATAAFKEFNCAQWGGGKAPLGGWLSPAYLYAKTRQAEGTFPDDAGATIIDEMATLNNFGVCPETWLPYQADPKQAPDAGCDVAAEPYRCGTPLSVSTDGDLSALRLVLTNERPVVCGFRIFESFERTAADGLVPDPVDGEGVLGGHALLCVGYRADGRFIIRNSWGAGWGDAGHCYVTPAFFAHAMEAWTTEKQVP